MSIIATTLKGLELSEPTVRRNLAVYPLMGGRGGRRFSLKVTGP